MTSSPTTWSRTTAAAAAAGRGGWASVRYYVCLGILVVSAAGMRFASERLGAYFRKEAVPLKLALAYFDVNKLAPAYELHRIQGRPLDEEQINGLGTEQYLTRRLVDTRRPPADPARVADVFITYYTGQPDMVPHVPDECYLAGGYDRVAPPETVSVSVPGVGAPGDEIPVRLVQFESREGRDRQTVLYFFHANGEYCTTRNEVRFKLANPFERYAYYAKIEIKFSDDPEGMRRPRMADKRESVAALGPLLSRLMPVLLADHLAWDRVRAETAPAAGGAGG